jgi:hypothetical protein
MEAEMRIGPYRPPIICKGLKENSVILVDIDGTLLPYADTKFEHQYHCECGHEFLVTSLDQSLPVSCSICGGTTFNRNEPSLAECRTIVGEILRKNVLPYPGAVERLKRLAAGQSIFYITGRDKRFFVETENWLRSNGFPYFPPHRLFMREPENEDTPYKMKGRFIENLGKRAGLLAVIDDDLSLITPAERVRAPFIWAPSCWKKNTYYGTLLEHLCIEAEYERNQPR